MRGLGRAANGADSGVDCQANRLNETAARVTAPSGGRAARVENKCLPSRLNRLGRGAFKRSPLPAFIPWAAIASSQWREFQRFPPENPALLKRRDSFAQTCPLERRSFGLASFKVNNSFYWRLSPLARVLIHALAIGDCFLQFAVERPETAKWLSPDSLTKYKCFESTVGKAPDVPAKFA
jgi:hypothetical protein